MKLASLKGGSVEKDHRMRSSDPLAWLQPMEGGDFGHPRWLKYKETGQLLSRLYEGLSGFRVPAPGMPSLFGDLGMQTVADSATALWLCKNAGPLFKEVAARLEDKRVSNVLDPARLVQDIVGVLKVEARYLVNRVQLDLLAKLMGSLAIGILPADTDWNSQLRELFTLQFESSSGSGWERPLMRWAMEIEIDRPTAALDERTQSFEQLFAGHEAQAKHWELNPWAYLLLRLELFRSATPMARKAYEILPYYASIDTYGWALFYEREYKRAEELISQVAESLQPGTSDWCEVQYHRVQVAFWSRRLSDARGLVDELQKAAPEDHWTARATELKAMITRAEIRERKRDQEYEYDVALSFAGENRHHADELARSLTELGLRIFYDDFERASVWGKDLYAELSDVYRNRARFCVIFVSEPYARKRWTDLERRAAQARALEENEPYILPIRLDETEIPGIGEGVSYMSWERDGLPLIVNAVKDKLTKAAHPAGKEGGSPKIEVRSDEGRTEPEKLLKILDLMSRTEKVSYAAPNGAEVRLQRTGTRRAPGPISVEVNGGNKGTIGIDGSFSVSPAIQHERQLVATLLRELDFDPEGMLRGSGLRTGVCSICGRRLTNPTSVARGMGPVCAANAGFRS